jgi:hypothetical protein
MQMDISHWIPYNPKIVLENTTKKFYGRYLYRLVVFCPAGRVIDNKNSVERELEQRKTISANIGGWWGERLARNLDQADPEFLERMRTLRHQKLPGTKMRVEEPRLQFYAESEDQLKNIIDVYFDRADYPYIESISGPEDDEAEAILNSGGIIRKRDLGYKHKVILRDGKYSTELKTSILNYLSSVGPDNVKIPATFSSMLTKSSSYMWNAYFYTNDPSIVTFINLLHPGLVSNIHELVVAPAK